MNEQGPPGVSAPIQFDQVELPGAASIKMCALCRAQITDTYYEAGGAVLCPSCSDKLTGRTSGATALPRALLYGLGAALLGTIVWFIIRRIGYELGIIAIAVGFFVGRAVRVGSGGRGGWKYQALAMFLTYASICSSYVPEIMQGIAQNAEAKKGEAGKDAKTAGADEAKTGADSAGAAATADQTAPQPKKELGAGGFILGLIVIFGLAFAAPFLMGASNIIGILIIAIALYEAWKLNKRIPVSGPFRMTSVVAVAGAPVGPAPGSP